MRCLLQSSPRTTTRHLAILTAPPAHVLPRRAVASSIAKAARPSTSLLCLSLAAGARDQRPADAARRRRPSLFAAMATSAADGAGAAAAPSSSSVVDWAALGLTPNAGEDVAVIGGGCFWCIEAAFNKLKGCSSAISGYAGGHVERPSYEEVCRKETGHAEVVAVYYDPRVVPYETVLRVFFALHDPTTRDAQGADIGPQYRSALYTVGEAQRAAALRVMAEVAAAKIWGDAPLVTEVAPLGKPGAGRFWPAEKLHQRYFEHSPEQPYCRFVVAPKVAKFRQQFVHLLK